MTRCVCGREPCLIHVDTMADRARERATAALTDHPDATVRTVSWTQGVPDRVSPERQFGYLVAAFTLTALIGMLLGAAGALWFVDQAGCLR